jgi:hypothetical protein
MFKQAEAFEATPLIFDRLIVPAIVTASSLPEMISSSDQTDIPEIVPCISRDSIPDRNGQAHGLCFKVSKKKAARNGSSSTFGRSGFES